MKATLVDRLGGGLASWVGFVSRRAPWILGGALLIFGALALWSVPRLGVYTDTADMISAELPWRQDFNDLRAAFPQLMQTLLVVVDSASEEDAETLRDALAARLAGADAAREIFVPGGDFYTRNALLLMPADLFEPFRQRLLEAQPVLARLARGPGLLEVLALAGDAAEHGEGNGAPRTLFAALAETIDAAARGESVPLSWRRLLHGEAGEPGRALLVIRPALDYAQLVPAAAAIAAVRAAASALDDAPAGRVRLTGPVAMEHEELLSVRQGVSMAGMLASVMVTVVLLAAFRSLRLLAATLVTLACGLIGVAAFAAEAVGRLNLISVAFAVLYIGLGIDFSIHFCLRFREAVAPGATAVAALRQTATDTGSALLLCAITTAVGFFAFLPTAFVGVAELGLISGVGMFIAFLVTMTVLPAILALLPPRPFRPLPRTAGVVARLAVLPRHRPGVVAGVALALVLLSAPAATQLRFDDNPLNLRDPATESMQTYGELQAGGEGSQHRLSVLVSDAGEEARLRQALESLPSVSHTEGFADLVPGEQRERLDAVVELDFIMSLPRELAAPGPVPTVAAFLRAAHSLQEQLAGLESPAAARLSAALANFAAALQQSGEPQQSQRLVILQDGLARHLPRAMSELRAALAVRRPIATEDVPGPLASRWLSEDGRRRIEVVPAGDLRDPAVTERFVSEVRRIAPQATGLPVVHLEAGRVVARAFLDAMLYAGVLIMALLALLFGSMWQALMVLLPLVVAMFLMAAATTMLGVPFNYANVVTLPLLLGIGVDNGIHMVRRHSSGLLEPGQSLHTSTTRAILFSGITTIVSFGNLAFASHPGIASMGLLLTLGMLLAMVATLVLLPALLNLGPPA